MVIGLQVLRRNRSGSPAWPAGPFRMQRERKPGGRTVPCIGIQAAWGNPLSIRKCRVCRSLGDDPNLYEPGIRWSSGDSNPEPVVCKATAHPIELPPHESPLFQGSECLRLSPAVPIRVSICLLLLSPGGNVRAGCSKAPSSLIARAARVLTRLRRSDSDRRPWVYETHALPTAPPRKNRCDDRSHSREPVRP